MKADFIFCVAIYRTEHSISDFFLLFLDSDRGRLNYYCGFVVTFRDWYDSKEAIKGLVLRHGLSSVVVDIKGEFCTFLLIQIKRSSTSSSNID